MGEPPRQLDGARVLCWSLAPSGSEYRLRGSHPPTARAVAVCRYDDGGSVYLFACSENWQVVQDWDCRDTGDAREMATRYALGPPIDWQTFPGEPQA